MKNSIKQLIDICLLATMSINISYAMAPTVLKFSPIKRTTAQIMQGQIAAPSSLIPAIPSLPTPGNPTVTHHFTVADYQETGQYGPSGESSVGSTQLLVASKGRVRSFLKDGTLDNVLNLSHDSFFSPISLGGFTADPNVIFHTQWKRWIVFADAFLHSTLVLAVSDSDPITPATVWSFYVIDKTANPGFGPSAFFDYTTLGVDDNAIYCAANILDYNNPNFFISAAVYAITKAQLAEPTATIYAWRTLRNLGPSSLSPFTIQPAHNFDTGPQAGYLASINLEDALSGNASTILLNTITFGGPTPLLSLPVAVPVQSYGLPISISVNGTPPNHPLSPVASFRFAPTHIRNNKLWLVANIGVNNEGVSTVPVAPPPLGAITRDAARFTQIDVTALATPAQAVVSQGTLFFPTADNQLGARSYLTPAIMSNGQGKVIIAATAASTQERLNAIVSQLSTTNTNVGEPVYYTASSSNYYATEDWEFNPFARWGDHTRISPDPVNGTFWTIQQWCSDTNTWGLEAAQIAPS